MDILSHTLPASLQRARKASRLSQLELSMRIGVSQRHVSFVENGRAKPSRELLMTWLNELEVPLAVRNSVMLQAGYAPAYSATPLHAPALEQANAALQQLLKTHDPMPAMVINAQWDLLHINRGAKWLASTLMPWAASCIANQSLNLLDMLVHPDGFAKMLVNLDEVGPVFLSELSHDVSVNPQLAAKRDAFAELLRYRLGFHGLHTSWTQPASPLLTLRFATRYGELAFFRMYSTFGTPQDITLSSLRVEHMFAADEATTDAIREYAGIDA